MAEKGGISKDDLRTCDMNWPLVAVGLEVCKQVLQTGFGFKHILPVYSGRRGGHLWICDERACRMDDAARDAARSRRSRRARERARRRRRRTSPNDARDRESSALCCFGARKEGV